jgi:hypothetical protein
MRWLKPEDGIKRVRTKFLWFPKTIYKETRWLETAAWKERYRADYSRWKPFEWVLHPVIGQFQINGEKTDK